VVEQVNDPITSEPNAVLIWVGSVCGFSIGFVWF